MDFHDVLGVPRTATQAEIDHAYRRVRQRVHPDVGGNEALLQLVEQAYATLGDPRRRASYGVPRSEEQKAQASERATSEFEKQAVAVQKAQLEHLQRIKEREQVQQVFGWGCLILIGLVVLGVCIAVTSSHPT